MNCTLCHEHKNIVYRDGAGHDWFSLCWDCLTWLGWETEKKALLPVISICSKCKQKFIPKRSGQKVCAVCWYQILSKSPRTQEQSITLIEMPKKQGLLAYG
jgi:DNA-directed RNA polymerase subunit RPC12/RpoP